MNKTPKTTSALIDFFLELRDLLKKPRFRSILVWMAILLASGTIFFSWVEGWSLLDSLYFSIVTLTTVGYGDLSPNTEIGKAFTILYIIFGMILIAASISVLAMERQVARTQQTERSMKEEESSL
jgi:voltage-gated potassium channel Kch